MNQTRQLTHGFGFNLGKTVLLYPVVFLVAMAGGMFILGLIFFAKGVLGASPGKIGFLSATWSVFYMCGCYFFRHLSATLPPRYSIFASSFMSFVCIGMIFLVQSLFWSFVFSSLYGLALSLFWPVVMGWISSGLEGKRFSRVMGWFNFSWSIGSIISPVVAGCLEDMGKSFALRGGSILFLAAAFLVFAGILTVPSLKDSADIQPRERNKNSGQERGTFLRYPAWLTVFASQFMAGTILTVIPLAAGVDIDITKKTVGILLLVRALIMSLTLVGMGQTSWWHFRGKQIAVGALIGVFVAMFLAYARSPVTIVFLLAFTGILVGQCYTNSVFHGVSGVAGKSWRMAVHEMIINAGLILGSISGGLAYGAFGIPAAYSISATVWLIDFIVVCILLTSMRRRELVQGILS